MRFHDLPPALLERVTVRKAEIAGFADLKDADTVATALKRMLVDEPSYQVFTFAAGMYFVVLMGDDVVEDTDVTHTNP